MMQSIGPFTSDLPEDIAATSRFIIAGSCTWLSVYLKLTPLRWAASGGNTAIATAGLKSAGTLLVSSFTSLGSLAGI